MSATVAYQEKTLIRTQTVFVGPDGIRVEREFFLPWWSQGERPIESFAFRELAPDCTVEPVFTKDLTIGVSSFVGFTAVALVVWLSRDLQITDEARALALLLPLASVALLAVTARRVREARFLTGDGNPAFAMCAAGRQRKQFDAAVGMLTARIRAAHAAG